MAFSDNSISVLQIYKIAINCLNLKLFPERWKKDYNFCIHELLLHVLYYNNLNFLYICKRLYYTLIFNIIATVTYYPNLFSTIKL